MKKIGAETILVEGETWIGIVDLATTLTVENENLTRGKMKC